MCPSYASVNMCMHVWTLYQCKREWVSEWEAGNMTWHILKYVDPLCVSAIRRRQRHCPRRDRKPQRPSARWAAPSPGSSGTWGTRWCHTLLFRDSWLTHHNAACPFTWFPIPLLSDSQTCFYLCLPPSLVSQRAEFWLLLSPARGGGDLRLCKPTFKLLSAGAEEPEAKSVFLSRFPSLVLVSLPLVSLRCSVWDAQSQTACVEINRAFVCVTTWGKLDNVGLCDLV